MILECACSCIRLLVIVEGCLHARSCIVLNNEGHVQDGSSAQHRCYVGKYEVYGQCVRAMPLLRLTAKCLGLDRSDCCRSSWAIISAQGAVSLVSNVIVGYDLLHINTFTSVNLLQNIQCTQGLWVGNTHASSTSPFINLPNTSSCTRPWFTQPLTEINTSPMKIDFKTTSTSKRPDFSTWTVSPDDWSGRNRLN
jgi:hypothetical protein